MAQRQFFRGPIAFELRLRSPVRRSWDATNYLGGVADVLESKYRRKNVDHLGGLVDLALYVNDRQIREVHYSHELARATSYEVRIWPLQTGTDPESSEDNKDRRLTGVLALDFANTAAAKSVSVREGFSDYPTLLQWLLGCGAITQAESAELHARAVEEPSAARRVFAEATELRDALIAVFRDHVAGPAERAALDVITRSLRSYLAGGTLVWRSGSYVTEWPCLSDEVGRTLWPIAASVEQVLFTKRTRQRVRQCAAADCERLFLDNSRNGTRQWCSMNRCGSLAKVRRFRQRHGAPKTTNRY
jgi:predicted RNA-binding Zn ribbon-like protein